MRFIVQLVRLVKRFSSKQAVISSIELKRSWFLLVRVAIVSRGGVAFIPHTLLPQLRACKYDFAIETEIDIEIHRAECLLCARKVSYFSSSRLNILSGQSAELYILLNPRFHQQKELWSPRSKPWESRRERHILEVGADEQFTAS